MADYDDIDHDHDGNEDHDSVLMESGGNRKGSSENGKGPHLKTPFQKKALEESFQDNQYPSEEARADLAEEIGLSVNQVNVWFTHRRRKHKKDEALAIVRGEMAAKDGKPSSSKPPSAKKGRPPARVEEEERGGGSDDESEATEDEEDVAAAVAAAEREEIIKLAEARLQVEVRPDGPTMGFEFDELPSVMPVKTGKRKRVQTRGGQMLEDGTVVPSSGKRSRNSSKKQQQLQERLRKRQEEEEVRRSKQLKEQERRARKEQERAIQLQQKLEQAMRKEAERKEKERQRERERLEREQAKEELRRQKEEERLRRDEERERQKELLAQEKEKQRMIAQQERERKKEIERLEKARAAEERRRETERRRQEKEAEKEKEREQRKREKEMKRALEAQEKAALKAQQRAAGIGQVEDDELEWEQLTKARHEQGYGSDTGGPDGEGMEIILPPFPPTEICLKKAFATAIETVAPDVAMVWSFCTSFPELLGLWPSTTLEELLRALVEGSGSRILGEVHIALIRLALADMEESQGKGVTHQDAKSVDRAVYNAAHTLEEAWAWGFETDLWRAHLTALTWPEVLRQVAVAAGRGRRRPNSAIDGKPVVGEEGEDVVESPKVEPQEGGAAEEDEAAAQAAAAAAAAELELRLKRPVRLKRGSLKACAWLVLTREGTEGLPVQDIAQRIEQEGLRDLSSCGSDAAAVLADALAHDLLFKRVAHGTFALSSIISHCIKLEEQARGSDEPVELSLEVLDDETDEATEWEDEDEDEAALAADELWSDATEDWVLALEDGDYNDLGLEDRVKALTLLVQMAVDGPTLRSRLETRMDESQKIKKQVQEDQKVEKRRKQAEAAAKAAEVAREAMKALEKQKVQLDLGPGAEGEGDTHQTGKDSIAEAAKKAMAEAESRIKKEGENPEAHTAEAQGDLQRRKERLDRLRCAEEATAIRFKPLGQDRRRNRYWRFVQSEGPAEDPTQGRIFVEDAVTGQWALIDSQEGAQILIDTLMQRGVREGALFKALKRYEGAIMSHLPSTPLQLPLIEEQTLAFEEARWLTTQSTNAMVAISKAGLPRPVPSELDASSGSARHLAKLKQDLADIELALPEEALEPGAIDREAWRDRLQAAGSPAELRACLGELEVSVVPTHLSPEFRLSPHLIKGAWIRCGKEVWRIPGQDEEPQFMQEYSAELSEPLEWLPPTVASVSLRLLSLDASLTYGGESGGPARDMMAAYRFIQRPAPPMPNGVGAAFHLTGHRHADREYVRFLFTVGDEERPLIFPEFPVQLIEDDPTPFELPADVILAKSFVPEPYRPQRLPAAGPGPSSKSSKGGSKSLGKKGAKGGRSSTGRGRGSKARGGAKAKTPARKAAPAPQLHAADEDEDEDEQHPPAAASAFAAKYGNEYEYGSVDDEDEDDNQGNTPVGVTPMASDDEDEEPEEDKLYEESESPEISDMDSD